MEEILTTCPDWESGREYRFVGPAEVSLEPVYDSPFRASRNRPRPDGTNMKPAKES